MNFEIIMTTGNSKTTRYIANASRAEAAAILRDLRKRGAYIWKTEDGYAADNVVYFA